jgi:hypothetical protein
LSNQNPCRSIKRPNISIKLKIVAELNAREALEREIGLEVTLLKAELESENQNLSLVSM